MTTDTPEAADDELVALLDWRITTVTVPGAWTADPLNYVEGEVGSGWAVGGIIDGVVASTGEWHNRGEDAKFIDWEREVEKIATGLKAAADLLSVSEAERRRPSGDIQQEARTAGPEGSGRTGKPTEEARRSAAPTGTKREGDDT